MTLTTGELTTLAGFRASLAQDFADMGAWVACHLEAELPGHFTYQMPVPDLDHEGKREWLRFVARSWDVPVRPHGDGGEIAVREFGRVRLVAHVGPEGSGTLAWLASARKASQAGSGAAA